MSGAKADASDMPTGRERAKHVGPLDSDLVVMPAAQVYELMKRALKDAGGGAGGGQLLVDKQQLAQRLSCSSAHIDKLRKQGLPCVKVGEAVRFDPIEVLDWLRQCRPENE
ncbi:MAG: Helix-turn-helix domain [Pseudomonadota bacterium]|jgi:predicted DNA-binding transcriptional regulator AlpA